MSKFTGNPADAGAASLSESASNPGGTVSASTTATTGTAGAAASAVPLGPPTGGLPAPFSSPGEGANAAAATDGSPSVGNRWEAHVVDKAGDKLRKRWVETPRGSEFTAEQAKEFTQVRFYDDAGVARPVSIEIHPIPVKEKRPASFVIPTIQPDPNDPTRGRVVGGTRLA